MNEFSISRDTFTMSVVEHWINITLETIHCMKESYEGNFLSFLYVIDMKFRHNI